MTLFLLISALPLQTSVLKGLFSTTFLHFCWLICRLYAPSPSVQVQEGCEVPYEVPYLCIR